MTASTVTVTKARTRNTIGPKPGPRIVTSFGLGSVPLPQQGTGPTPGPGQKK